MAEAITPEDLSECPDRALAWLARSRVADTARGLRILQNAVSLLGGGDASARLLRRLESSLGTTPDPDRALVNLDRVLAALARHCINEFVVGEFLEHLEQFLWAISASQYIADQLVCDPGLAEWVLRHAGPPLPAEQLRQELNEVIGASAQEEDVLRLLRRTRHRHIVRIGFADLVLGVPLDQTLFDLSDLADVLIDVALQWSMARAVETYGVPRTGDGSPGRISVLGMGKLGGQELNYSSDIDLIIFYDAEGYTDGSRQISCEEFWRRVAARTVRLLTSYTADGYVYRVDLRLRPDGRVGAMVRSLDSMLSYYQTVARTWELQAMIKARPCAGDLELGKTFLTALEPLVFRRFLTAEQITEIKVLKKRIEERGPVTDGVPRDVKLSSGGIRDVEFVVQFLQMLHGAAVPQLRERNTIQALRALERAGCLTEQERAQLEEAYRFLRNVEHRLQLFADRQTHELPDDSRELAALARKLGYRGDDDSVGRAFLRDLKRLTSRNRRILSYLLQDAFRATADEVVAPESELVLDPEPDAEKVTRILQRYGFRDPAGAHRLLQRLAAEPVPFLSSLRCRHQMAAITPRLLRLLGDYPDPDRTLARLEVASQAMGARGALWELFRVHPEAMRVVLDICAYAEMLYQMLCRNPGMFDDLVDALELRTLPDASELDAELSELLQGAKEPLPILQNFRASYDFRTGVRLFLGKERGAQAARSLRDLASVSLTRLSEIAFKALCRRYGVPLVAKGRRAVPCRWAILVGGLLGWGVGSFLDPLFFGVVYEADGVTRHETRRRGWEPTTSQHFFHELARSLTAMVGTTQFPTLRLQPGLAGLTRGASLAYTAEQIEELMAGITVEHPEYLWSRFLAPNRRFASRLEERLWKRFHPPATQNVSDLMEPGEALRALLGWLAQIFNRQRKLPRDPWEALRRWGVGLTGEHASPSLVRSAQFLVEFRQFGHLVSARGGEPAVTAELEYLLRTRPWLQKDLEGRSLASLLEEHLERVAQEVQARNAALRQSQ